MGDKSVGLTQKYRVERLDGKPVEWAFVLEDTDPLAWRALDAYAMAARGAEYGALARDLDMKVVELRDRHARNGGSA